jgi:hypothetical protein
MWASWAIFALIGLEVLPRSLYSGARSVAAWLGRVVGHAMRGALSAAVSFWGKVWRWILRKQASSSDEADGGPQEGKRIDE